MNWICVKWRIEFELNKIVREQRIKLDEDEENLVNDAFFTFVPYFCYLYNAFFDIFLLYSVAFETLKWRSGVENHDPICHSCLDDAGGRVALGVVLVVIVINIHGYDVCDLGSDSSVCGSGGVGVVKELFMVMWVRR